MDNKTPYSNYSQSQLTAIFSAESWKGLSFSEKMNACQEVENRYAAENNVQPCTVTHEKMDGACYGWQSGNTICLNTYLVQDGQFCTHYTDQNGVPQEVRTNALAPGWNTLDTVYHEGTHGIQESTGRMPSTYISPEMDGDLYRIQGIEKEAYATGQLQTLNAISSYEKNVGHLDSDRNDYIASVKNDSFQAALADAARNYNDPNIEQTLQNVIDDRENNITRENTTDSYQAISNLCDVYGVHSSVDLSNSEEPTSGVQPSVEIDDPVSQASDNTSQGVETPIGTEENTVDDGMNNEDNEAIENSVDDGMDNFESEGITVNGSSIDNETSLVSTENDGMGLSTEEDYNLETLDVSEELDDENPISDESTYDDGAGSVESTSDYGGTSVDSGSSVESDDYSGDESAGGYSGGGEGVDSGGISSEE